MAYVNECPPEFAEPPGEDAPEPAQPPESGLFVALAIGALAALAMPAVLSAALGAAPRRSAGGDHGDANRLGAQAYPFA